MQFDDFCRAHGLIVGQVIEGRWVRVATTDHPKKKNGAYKFLGNVGFCQNHATSIDVSTWKPDATAPNVDHQAIANRAAQFEADQRAGWKRAAMRASEMLRTAELAEHNYLIRKGLGDVRGLVLPDGSLFVPMRSLDSNELVGAQAIRWVADEMRWDKKMLPGMRAKSAVFRIGPKQAATTFLCEGYATGLSIELAARLLRLNAAVLVCFSAGNLIHVAPLVKGRKIVFADNDVSRAGESAAVKTGLPYRMSPIVGEDANDAHVRAGLFELGSMLIAEREMDAVP